MPDSYRENKSKIFNALSKIHLDAIAIAQASDGLNLSIIVPTGSGKETANSINEEFQLIMLSYKVFFLLSKLIILKLLFYNIWRKIFPLRLNRIF